MTRLKEIRILKGITQHELSIRSNTNIRTIQAYEVGAKKLDNANIKTILKLCSALDCSLLDIIEDEEVKYLLKNVK